MRKTILGVVGLGCIAMGCASSTAAGPAGAAQTTPEEADSKYAIVIARPLAVGLRARVEVIATESVDAFAMDDTEAELDIEGTVDERQVTLAGELEVLGVDERGQVHRAELRVETFRDDLVGREILPSGSKLLATREGNDFAVVVDGQPPSEDLTPWLRLAFPLGRPGGKLVGDALAPSTPKAVGETWEVSKSAAVTDLAGDGYQTTESSIEGTATLLGIKECGTGQCLELVGQLHAEAVTFAGSSELNVSQGGVVEGSARLLIPIDPQQPVFLEDAEGNAAFVADVDGEQDEAASQARVLVRRRRVATYIPVH